MVRFFNRISIAPYGRNFRGAGDAYLSVLSISQKVISYLELFQCQQNIATPYGGVTY